jgi:hypothetical protein
MIVYHIQLPKKQDAEAFVKFMSEEYFPAVHKGATRVGQVTDLRLLQRENAIEGEDVDHEFFWHVGWSGQPTGNAHVDDAEVARKFEAFHAEVKRIGPFREVASGARAT